MKSIGIAISKTKKYPSKEDIRKIAEKEREITNRNVVSYRMFSWGDTLSLIDLNDYPSAPDCINKLDNMYKYNKYLREIGFVETRLLYTRVIKGPELSREMPKTIILTFFKKSLTTSTDSFIKGIEKKIDSGDILYILHSIGWESVIVILKAKNISNKLKIIKDINHDNNANSYSIIAFTETGEKEKLNALISLKFSNIKDPEKEIYKIFEALKMDEKDFVLSLKPGWFDAIVELKNINIKGLSEFIERIRENGVVAVSHTVVLSHCPETC